MATARDLFHVSEVIRHLLDERITAVNLAQIIAGGVPQTPPNQPGIRVTLAWVQEQPTHRSDGFQRQPDGSAVPAPATLSVFYLVTTYGEDSNQNLVNAHGLLGDVLRVLHAEPVLALPGALATLPGTNSVEGRLGFTLVPMTPDLMEKLFAPFQIQHRPFALYEVGPVQLLSLLPTRPPGPLVGPGQVRLAGPSPRGRPAVRRLVPSTVAEGAWLRIDGDFDAAVSAVLVGAERVEPGPDLVVVEAGRSVAVRVTAAIRPGVHPVTVLTGPLASDPSSAQVVPAGTFSLDGPNPARLVLGVPTTLSGQGLGSVDRLLVWPDGGIRSPTDVREFTPTAVSAASVVATFTGLAPGDWRVVARMRAGPVPPPPAPPPPYLYTPFVVVEVRA